MGSGSRQRGIGSSVRDTSPLCEIASSSGLPAPKEHEPCSPSTLAANICGPTRRPRAPRPHRPHRPTHRDHPGHVLAQDLVPTDHFHFERKPSIGACGRPTPTCSAAPSCRSRWPRASRPSSRTARPTGRVSELPPRRCRGQGAHSATRVRSVADRMSEALSRVVLSRSLWRSELADLRSKDVGAQSSRCENDRRSCLAQQVARGLHLRLTMRGGAHVADGTTRTARRQADAACDRARRRQARSRQQITRRRRRARDTAIARGHCRAHGSSRSAMTPRGGSMTTLFCAAARSRQWCAPSRCATTNDRDGESLASSLLKPHAATRSDDMRTLDPDSHAVRSTGRRRRMVCAQIPGGGGHL